MIDPYLLVDSLIRGIFLGGFYALLSVGLAISFGLLDIVNLTHPTFILLMAYGAYQLNMVFGLDPVVSGFMLSPIGFITGILIHHGYSRAIEVRGRSLEALVLFFALIAIMESSLALSFGVEYISVYAPYLTAPLRLGFITTSLRIFLPFIVGLAITIAIYFLFTYTATGRAIRAVVQDKLAASLMGCNPERLKSIAMGVSLATTAIAGGLFASYQVLDPFASRVFIGRVFAIVVLGGMGSILGTCVGAMIIGIAESLTTVLISPAWATGISFLILALVIGIKPTGLFRR